MKPISSFPLRLSLTHEHVINYLQPHWEFGGRPLHERHVFHKLGFDRSLDVVQREELHERLKRGDVGMKEGQRETCPAHLTCENLERCEIRDGLLREVKERKSGDSVGKKGIVLKLKLNSKLPLQKCNSQPTYIKPNMRDESPSTFLQRTQTISVLQT